jgi:hypothetical protein
MAAAPPVKLLKNLIWVYLILLLTEGALRKWVVPSLATPLAVIRDPLVILIYMVASSCRRFPMNGFVAGSFLLAAAAFCASFLAPNTSLIITVIGLRCYFLHLPLIFVMEQTLEAEDLWRMGKFLFWFAIPETILCVLQFSEPQGAWVNLSLGGQVTQGFSGALDKFRPSGTFSFTTGVAEFYPLTLAMLLGFLLTQRKLAWYLSVSAAVCVAIAIPISISRTNALTCALVLIISCAAVFALPRSPQTLVRVIFFLGIVTLIASWLPRFDEGVQAFGSRWADSTGPDANSFGNNIVMRFFQDLIPPMDVLESAPLTGYGAGIGTPMAQVYVNGSRTFILAEGEWPRLLLELGPVLGLAFILLRMGICMRLFRLAIVGVRRENVWPAILGVQAFLLVLNSQWAQATTQGFATFSAGLAFAATRMTVARTAPARRRRRPRPPQWSPPNEPVALPGSPS